MEIANLKKDGQDSTAWFTGDLKEAMFWHPTAGTGVQCELCRHECKISDGKTGICGVRKNNGGKLYTLVYGYSSGMHADPIEKKPLYHFYPGTDVMSYGSVGCNFACPFCQNYEISQEYKRLAGMMLYKLTPEKVVSDAKKYSCAGIAWTYNEPTLWYEFTYDTSVLAKKAGLYTVYVTNGYISEAPLRKIAPYLDAMNIDVKAFGLDFYRGLCKAKLDGVLQTCELAKKLNIHVELTYLIIPEQNDEPAELETFCEWVADKMGKDTPCHFSRFHADYKMVDAHHTPMETMVHAYDTAKNFGLENVYLGNILDVKYESTYCPNCKKVAISRAGYEVEINYEIDDEKGGGRCKKCGAALAIITRDVKK